MRASALAVQVPDVVAAAAANHGAGSLFAVGVHDDG